MNLFKFTKNDDEDIKKCLIFNELRDIIKSINNYNYYILSNFYINNSNYISIEDLYKYTIIYGNIDILEYLNKEYNGINIFFPFYSYLLNSIKNIDNIDMYYYGINNYKNILPTFEDLLIVIEHHNIDLLIFFINNFNIYEPNEDEIKRLNKNFNIINFLESLKKSGNTLYIEKVFEVILHSNFLQNLIIQNICKNIDFTYISKKYFFEAIMKSIIDKSSFSHSNNKITNYCINYA